MAYEISAYSIKISAEASVDYSALSNQYCFVKLNASGQAVLCAAATDVPVGVMQNNPKAGQEAEIIVAGGTKVKASAAISVGTAIGTTSSGTAVGLTPATANTAYAVGQPLTPAGASGDVFTAVINCAAPNRAA